MTSCKVESPPGQPPIVACCLIPEYRPPRERADEPERIRHEHLRDLMWSFVARFDRGFILTAAHGLVPWGEVFKPSPFHYSGMTNSNKHQWEMKVRDQFRPLLKVGERVICLVTGVEMRALRKLQLPLIVPVAGMSERMRRLWLEDRVKESNFALGLAIYGSAADPSPNGAATGFRGNPAAWLAE